MSEIILDICRKLLYTGLNRTPGPAPGYNAREVHRLSRPRKCRTICRFPQTLGFVPTEYEGGKMPVFLTVDEYETIHLIDREELSQEECGDRMRISRTTVQQIYASARRKLADALVDGRPLVIGGGDYRLCDGKNQPCGVCRLQTLRQTFSKPKGRNIMRVAVTYENGEIFQHFGRTEQFKIYDIADKRVVSSEVVGTNGVGHGALAEVLRTLRVDALICGGIGGGAQAALAAAGIRLYGGVSGSADEAVNALLDGSLAFNPDVHCDHHGHHHGEGEACGDHGCHHGGGEACGDHGCHGHNG